jgi:hypothetical protein
MITDEDLGFILKAIFIASIAYFILMNSILTIVVTDSYVVVHREKFGKRLEFEWEDITQVSEARVGLISTYKVVCRNKPAMFISSIIANYKDLLRENVERSPNAIVDNSVRRLLEDN